MSHSKLGGLLLTAVKEELKDQDLSYLKNVRSKVDCWAANNTGPKRKEQRQMVA
jgi:hypothetical protein